MTSREAKVEEELYHLIKSVLEAKHYELEGVRFGDIEPQFRVNAGIADLMLPIQPKTPRLIIECKRKKETPRGLAEARSFDPLSHLVIDQALDYAIHSGATMFATTNGRIFALFEVPRRGEPFRIDRHRILLKEIQLKEDAITEILVVVARSIAGIAVARTELDWTFILRLRSFVEYLYEQFLPITREWLENKSGFQEKFTEFSRKIGGLSQESFAREAAYILMNKIVFYKILERQYGELPKLQPIHEVGREFARRMRETFDQVVPVTKDFEPVFSAGIYDEIPIGDEQTAIDELNSFVEDMEKYRLEEIGSDIVGLVYERLIPDEERHRLGQFYTPPQVAELISRWSIRGPNDTVLDPGVGSGTFLIKAYTLLKRLKVLQDQSMVHREILSQLLCIDINPFPAQLTAMNLAMRDVRHPVSEMNIVVDDFFNIRPRQTALAPYSMRTARGIERREIRIDEVNVVLGNPPYTRWLEIPDTTREAISSSIGGLVKQYGLQARVRAGFEIGIYVYFLLHASQFLRPHGRLGMIISNSWLQNDFGVSFGGFLLDNFRIVAVIDFSARLFSLPLVATCVVLLEKESDSRERSKNQVLFMRVETETTVDQILDVIGNPEKADAATIVNVKQSELPRGKTWIGIMFGTERLERKLSVKTVPLRTFFEPFRGTMEYTASKSRGLGANEFFYLPKKAVSLWGVEKFSLPLLSSPRYSKYYTFTESDWRRIGEKDSPSYLFHCSKPSTNLPRAVLEYIHWGETECKTKTGDICSQSQACKERQKDIKNYKGWYDVGPIREAQFFTSRYAQYSRRFALLSFGCTLDDDLIAFRQISKITQQQLKAMLAYLNSSIGQFYIELRGRTTGGGMVALEAQEAGEIPVPDVKKMGSVAIKRLASLFDTLEAEARKTGGADTREKLKDLQTTITKIDDSLLEIVDISQKDLRELREIVNLMMSRRISRAKEARPESIGGEQPRIRPPPKRRSSGLEDRLTPPLQRWTK